MLQTGNKGFCPGLPGRSVLEVAPLRSLVGAQGGAELSYVLFVTAVPPSQTLYWIFFSFLKLWTRIPTCPLKALSSDHPESINPCVAWGKFGVLFVWKNILINELILAVLGLHCCTLAFLWLRRAGATLWSLWLRRAGATLWSRRRASRCRGSSGGAQALECRL